jgi:hypothetical protein
MAAPLRKPPTHTAWAFRRLGKKPHMGYWLEVGTGRKNEDGTFDSFMDRTPIGGFNGHVSHRPIGSPPPSVPQAKPQRPGEEGDDAGDEDDGDTEA